MKKLSLKNLFEHGMFCNISNVMESPSREQFIILAPNNNVIMPIIAWLDDKQNIDEQISNDLLLTSYIVFEVDENNVEGYRIRFDLEEESTFTESELLDILL